MTMLELHIGGREELEEQQEEDSRKVVHPKRNIVWTIKVKKMFFKDRLLPNRTYVLKIVILNLVRGFILQKFSKVTVP